MPTVTDEVTDLLRHLIRNACVNDGSADSGHELASVEVLASYLEGVGLDLERYDSGHARGNLVARIEGTDPGAPSLLLMGHTDVVPANPDLWRRDPFGAELVDGEVWGRGAVDMLNLTASMAVAMRHLAAEGFAPRGTLIYLACADEEALGTYGAEWMLENRRDAVWADHVITESGGFTLPLPSTTGRKLPVIVGEKGAVWCSLRVHGTPGHASTPLRTDNALVKAAEVVSRIAAYEPAAALDDVWRAFVERYDLPPELARRLGDADGVREFCANYDDLGVAREVHAVTHTTLAPTVARGGVKTNVIPDTVDLQVDIRTLPGQDESSVRAMLAEALGDLAGSVDVHVDTNDLANASPFDTPLWDSLARVSAALVPGASIVPMSSTGATDARFFRALGATAYGYGLFGERLSYADYVSMFHGNDERVDQESLRLSTELWSALARDFLG